MSAFGRRNGPGAMAPGARPQFGVARPMKGGPPPAPAAPQGGEQFPPLPGEHDAAGKGDAMARLADRANAVHESTSQVGGFEQSVHKIKEQVLPRLPLPLREPRPRLRPLRQPPRSLHLRQMPLQRPRPRPPLTPPQ